LGMAIFWGGVGDWLAGRGILGSRLFCLMFWSK